MHAKRCFGVNVNNVIEVVVIAKVFLSIGLLLFVRTLLEHVPLKFRSIARHKTIGTFFTTNFSLM